MGHGLVRMNRDEARSNKETPKAGDQSISDQPEAMPVLSRSKGTKSKGDQSLILFRIRGIGGSDLDLALREKDFHQTNQLFRMLIALLSGDHDLSHAFLHIKGVGSCFLPVPCNFSEVNGVNRVYDIRKDCTDG
jgi:hypothetical protein